jgi:hypothetical protein
MLEDNALTAPPTTASSAASCPAWRYAGDATNRSARAGRLGGSDAARRAPSCATPCNARRPQQQGHRRRRPSRRRDNAAPRRSTPRASAPAPHPRDSSRTKQTRGRQCYPSFGASVLPINRSQTSQTTRPREDFLFSGSRRPSATALARRAGPVLAPLRAAGPPAPAHDKGLVTEDDTPQATGPRVILINLLRASGPAFSMADSGHGRPPPVKALTVPAGSRCA